MIEIVVGWITKAPNPLVRRLVCMLETQVPNDSDTGAYRAKDGANGNHAYCFVWYVEARDGNTNNQDEIQDGQTQPHSQQDDMCIG